MEEERRNEPVLRKLDSFKKNVTCCKNSVFGLRYSDLTAMTGIPGSTLSTYDLSYAFYVAPPIGVCDQMARAYCTSVERLCSYDLGYDPDEKASLMEAFIRRVGKMDARKCLERAGESFGKRVSVSEEEVLLLLREMYGERIRELCEEGAYCPVPASEETAAAFTGNLSRLMGVSGVSYRRLGKVCGISIGNLTRLRGGAEPSLSSVIRVADFFGLSIGELLSPDPGFDDARIVREAETRTALTNVETPLPEEVFRKVNRINSNVMTVPEAMDYMRERLEKIG